MELEIAFGHRQQSRMMEQDRVSQASSVVTVSSTRDNVDKKLQSFCKRSRSVQRDPNCAVVIRGWLYKRDSTGLKLWKRRWFVLSNYCLFYYKDSREECVLGSLPLPSYKIFFCSPRECKNRKYAFKVVHQGMRSYLLSADTQEDMLGWVRALSQSACMETDDLINRRCSSYHDFSQIGGSTESVNPLHVYRTHSKPSHCTLGSVDMADHRGRERATYSSDTRTRSLSLDRTGEDHILCQRSVPSTPRSHYESRPRSPLGRVDLRPQVYSTHHSPVHKAESKEIRSDQLPPLPSSRITHNPLGPLPHSTSSVCGFPSSTCEKEMRTLTALQGDTDMVLTCLCGCDKVLQTLSVELDLLQQDKEHAEFALDMSRIELGKGQLNVQHISQKALLQEELVTIRARMCDISQEMERVWLDYKRMESELCVFRSHLQHICHFGLAQEHSLAQKQIWMMDDILSGLKPNRSRFKALMALQTPTMFPLLHNSSLHPEESVHLWGEELEPPARPPLPLELDSTNKSTNLRPEWGEPNYTLVYNPATINTHCSTQTKTHTAESQSLCLGEESDHSKQMVWRFEQKKMHNKRSRSPDYKIIMADKPHPLTESSPVCLMRVMRAELPSSLTAQRVCVEESNPEEDKLNTLNYKQEEQSDNNDNVDVCVVNRESDLAMPSEQRHAKLKRVERIRERVLKSALRRSDSAHPLKFIDIGGSVNHCQRSTDSLHTDRVCIHGNMWMTESDVPEAPPSLSDIKPSPTNHISTLTINNMVSEETDQSVNCSTSTNRRAEWFLSTNHWQGFIPLNIEEEELSPTNQRSDTSTNQVSELSTNQTHVRGKLNMTTSLVPMETLDQNNSDHTGRELCIYEEIQYKAPESAIEENDSVVGGAKAHQSNLSTNHSDDSHLSVNQHASLEVGGRESRATREEVAKEAGSDIIISAKTKQPIYSCWNKNSVTNPSDSFLKPRVTVVSTSL
ncbi:uncharacterized protein si:ch211-234p6.5 isoform X1 [Ictalurus punctatus]|uniref:Uncharacterized protein si:ch211-234p6.5 isoform X1 n=1 Tax=Ictalurus punctatus TaxID=7998 RepID=A0A9F7TKT4_ICTPU|nr:uncharacterized protein si:ch211-234p6.5 isoform X1 [Ictalurus punctatus]